MIWTSPYLRCIDTGVMADGQKAAGEKENTNAKLQGWFCRKEHTGLASERTAQQEGIYAIKICPSVANEVECRAKDEPNLYFTINKQEEIVMRFIRSFKEWSLDQTEIIDSFCERSKAISL